MNHSAFLLSENAVYLMERGHPVRLFKGKPRRGHQLLNRFEDPQVAEAH